MSETTEDQSNGNGLVIIPLGETPGVGLAELRLPTVYVNPLLDVVTQGITNLEVAEILVHAGLIHGPLTGGPPYRFVLTRMGRQACEYLKWREFNNPDSHDELPSIAVVLREEEGEFLLPLGAWVYYLRAVSQGEFGATLPHVYMLALELLGLIEGETGERRVRRRRLSARGQRVVQFLRVNTRFF